MIILLHVCYAPAAICTKEQYLNQLQISCMAIMQYHVLIKQCLSPKLTCVGHLGSCGHSVGHSWVICAFDVVKEG